MKKQKMMLVMLLSTIVMSGCSQSEVEEVASSNIEREPIQLTVWGGDKDQELLAEMTESFKEVYTDQASFEIQIESVNEDICKNLILGEVSEAPDVFTFADDQVMEFAAAGVLEPIEEAEKIQEANSGGSVEAVSINGKLYAYPMTADNGYFMFYNKQYLSEEDVKSLESMLEVASRLNKKVTMDWTGWYIYSFFGNTGLSLGLNSDGLTNECDWNSTTGKIKGSDVGQAMLAIAKNPGFMNTNDEGLMAGAKDGSVIAGVSGVWAANVLQEAWGEHYGATKLPTYTCAGEQIQLASYAGYKLIGVNAYSEEKEWAAKLAQWLTNEENQALRFEKRGLGPSNKLAANTEAIKQSIAIQALIEQSEYASLQRVGAKYWEPIAAFSSSILEGRTTAANMQSVLDETVKAITMKVTD